MVKTEQLLHNSKIGMWVLELNDKPCLYIDDNLKELLGLDKELSPEETYEYWYDRVDKNYISYVNGMMLDIVNDKASEVEYPWNHPIYGKRYVRCGGYVSKNYANKTIEGYLQDIDDLIKNKNSLDNRHELFDQLSYVNYSSYYMDIYDEMAIVDIDSEIMKWIFRIKDKYIDIKSEEKFFDVIRAYIHEEDQQKIKDTYNYVKSEVGLKEYIEVRIKHLDNHYSWVRMMLTSVIFNNRNKVLTGVIDIDKIKKNEETSNDVQLILDVISKENLYIYDVDFNKNIVRIIKDNKDDFEIISFEEFDKTVKSVSCNFTECEKLEKFLDFNHLKEMIKEESSKHLDVQLLKDNVVQGWYRLSYATSSNLENRILISVKNIERDDILSSIIYQYMIKNFESIFYIDLKEDNYRRFLIDDEIGIRIQEYNSYTNGIDYFVDNYVVEKDKDRVKEKLDNKHIWDIFKQENFYYTSIGINDDKNEFHEKGLYFYVFDEQKQIFLVLINDITKAYYQKIEQEKVLRRLRKNATIDELTGLSNRYHCEASIMEYLMNEGYDQLSALLLMDLDNFKTLNDTLGHRMGDTALKDVANILKEYFRSTDVISRYGGDEFVILMKNIRDVGVVDILLPRLLDKLKLKYSEDGKEVEIGASIGVVYIPYDGRNINELFDKADKTLYEVKKKGKGNYKVYNF